MSNRALILIDLQNEFLSAEIGRFLILPQSQDVLIPNVKELVPAFRAAGGHVVWIKSVYELGEKQKGNKRLNRDEWLSGTHTGLNPCCKEGSVGAELYPPVASLVDEQTDSVVVKRNYSAFKDTNLLSLLQDKGIQELYVAGLLSTTCVLATLLGATEHLPQIKLHTVVDCLGYRKETSHAGALSRMQGLGIELVQSNEVLNPKEPEGPLSIPRLYYVNGSIPSWRVHITLYEKASTPACCLTSSSDSFLGYRIRTSPHDGHGQT